MKTNEINIKASTIVKIGAAFEIGRMLAQVGLVLLTDILGKAAKKLEASEKKDGAESVENP